MPGAREAAASGSVPPMSPSPAALTGTLAEVPLPVVLGMVEQGGHTGALRFGGEARAELFVAGGALYFASSDTAPALDRLFVDAGVVTTNGWGAAADGAPAAIAEALVRIAGADAERVKRTIQEQIVTTVFELLAVSDVTFELHDGLSHPVGPFVRFTPRDVLREADRRLRIWRQIATSVPSTSAVARLAPSLPADSPGVTVSPAEWEVLAALDGRRTVGEVIELVGESAFAICAVLHKLHVAGAVEIG